MLCHWGWTSFSGCINKVFFSLSHFLRRCHRRERGVRCFSFVIIQPFYKNFFRQILGDHFCTFSSFPWNHSLWLMFNHFIGRTRDACGQKTFIFTQFCLDCGYWSSHTGKRIWSKLGKTLLSIWDTIYLEPFFFVKIVLYNITHNSILRKLFLMSVFSSNYSTDYR